MSKIHHRAFRVEYKAIARQLISDILVTQPGSVLNLDRDGWVFFRGIWDTGATHTVVTQHVVDTLGLSPIDMVKVSGVNSESTVPVMLVDIGLPNRLIIPNRRVTVCSIGNGIDVLIGMDIIALGDFSISNLEGKTVFTFAMPSFQNRTDLFDKAEAVNNHKK